MRKCGECQLCCKVIAIAEIGKPANKRCPNQKFGVGCKVHGTAAQPPSCSSWSCWWLADPSFDLPRPDRAGYVVDTMPDFVVFGDDAFTGKRVAALQVWVDQSRPKAWSGAEEWLKKAIGDRPMVAVIRFGNQEAITFVPPQLSPTQDWMLVDSRMLKATTAQNIRLSLAQKAREAMEAELEKQQNEQKQI